jgi:hypothetical protein
MQILIINKKIFKKNKIHYLYKIIIYFLSIAIVY